VAIDTPSPPTSRRRRRRTPEVAEQEIIAAAAGLLRERPFRELTVDEVMRRTDLSRPSFYVYFRGLHHLAVRLVEGIGAELFAVARRNVLALATDLDHSIELRGDGIAHGLVLLGSRYTLHRRGSSPLTLAWIRQCNCNAHLSWVGHVQPGLLLAGKKDTVRVPSLKVAGTEVNTNF